MRTFPKGQLTVLIMVLLGGIVLLGIVQTQWVPGQNWGFPVDASVEGYRIDRLIIVTGVFVTILFAVMCAWMAWACIKHGKDHVPEYDHGAGKASVVTALCLSGAIFLVVDGNLFVNSAHDVTQIYWNWEAPEEDANATRIEVNAHQWAWDARHAGPDGTFTTADDIVTLNEIRVPVGRPVTFQVASTDVLHSFSIPAMRQKVDAVPGSITRMWFTPKTVGAHEIACMQHCGMAHYLMRGHLVVMEQEDYDAWAAHASEVARIAHDPEDPGAHWGWAWQEL